MPERMTGHVIVCGLSNLGQRIVEQLGLSGSPAVVVDDGHQARAAQICERYGVPLVTGPSRRPHTLLEAGIGAAAALICVEEDALASLETVLVARDLRPDLRVVVQMANEGVGHALGNLIGARSVLDTAALAAPSVVEGCRQQATRELMLGGEQFAVVDQKITAPGTLRSFFRDLAPVAIEPGDGSPVELSPGRDREVSPGDTVTVIGTPGEFAASGVPLQLAVGADADSAQPTESMGHRLKRDTRRIAKSFWALADRPLRWALIVFITVVVAGTIVLRLSSHAGGPHLSTLRALFYTIETIATIGFGSVSSSQEPPWLELFLTGLILVGMTMVTVTFALVTNLLFSRQISEAFGKQRITHMRGHAVVIGFGAVGVLVVKALLAAGENPIVIERDESNRHLGTGRALGVPIIIGDATQTETLDDANVADASAVAVLTSNDLTNIETGLAVRDYLGPQRASTPVVMRIFDRSLGRMIEQNFDFRNVRSTSALAAPWFVGAALGLDVLSTFYVDQELLLVARLTVAPSGGLAGVPMHDLPARIRVVALGRAPGDGKGGGRSGSGSSGGSGSSSGGGGGGGGGEKAVLEHPPRRDTRFAPGDQAYLIGPYDELLSVLRRDAAGVVG